MEAELITLAIGNLLDNAIDFTPAGSTVRVEVDGATVAVRTQAPACPTTRCRAWASASSPLARPGGERSGSGLGWRLCSG